VVLIISLQGCQSTNTSTESSTNSETKEQGKASLPPSEVAENGLCMADTLSFLVGQPETALEAMQYPENTRILVHGQVVNPGIDPTRLNLVLGLDRNIKFVYCG
tara:strand:- start:91 stop:402 length:312 start_codon:yes stop_codon:yes gene_type:complete